MAPLESGLFFFTGFLPSFGRLNRAVTDLVRDGTGCYWVLLGFTGFLPGFDDVRIGGSAEGALHLPLPAATSFFLLNKGGGPETLSI